LGEFAAERLSNMLGLKTKKCRASPELIIGTVSSTQIVKTCVIFKSQTPFEITCIAKRVVIINGKDEHRWPRPLPDKLAVSPMAFQKRLLCSRLPCRCVQFGGAPIINISLQTQCIVLGKCVAFKQDSFEALLLTHACLLHNSKSTPSILPL
jgi:hypothetical protein